MDRSGVLQKAEILTSTWCISDAGRSRLIKDGTRTATIKKLEHSARIGMLTFLYKNRCRKETNDANVVGNTRDSKRGRGRNGPSRGGPNVPLRAECAVPPRAERPAPAWSTPLCIPSRRARLDCNRILQLHTADALHCPCDRSSTLMYAS
jgi:hypothetical protein